MLIICGLLLFCYLVNQGRLHQTKWAAILIFLATTFVMGWRNAEYGPDSIHYVYFFEQCSQLTVQEAWTAVFECDAKDRVFYLVGTILSHWGYTYRGWFVLIAAVFTGGFCFLMYKRSDDFSLSVFLLIVFSYFYFAMTGLRQSMALGFCFFAFEFICQRKLWAFLILVAIGGLFHSSGWVFFVMYPLCFVSFNSKYLVLILAAPLIAILFPNLLGAVIRQIAWNDALESYGYETHGLTITGYIIEASIFLFCSFCYVTGKLNNKNAEDSIDSYNPKTSCSARDDIFLKCALIALAWGATLRAFSINIDNFFRIAMYFSCYSVLVVPSVLGRLSANERKYALFIIIPVGTLFALRAGHYTNFSMF